jgi:hypothetical protein
MSSADYSTVRAIPRCPADFSQLTGSRASGTREHGSELFTDHGRNAGSKNLNRPQHRLMRKRRDAHLERNARETTEDIVHVEYFLRDSPGVADQECTCGSAQSIELCPCSWWPAAFFSNFGEGVRVPRVKVIRSLPGSSPRESDGFPIRRGMPESLARVRFIRRLRHISKKVLSKEDRSALLGINMFQGFCREVLKKGRR